MADADFDDPEWIDPAGQFRRDLPVLTGDAREQLRRAGDDLRRAFTGIGQALDAIDAHPKDRPRRTGGIRPPSTPLRAPGCPG